MMQKLTETPGPESREVFQLLAQRAQVQGWIHRLEEHAGAVNERIVARVRADYEGRLQQTVEELMGHRAAVQSRFEQASTRLIEAETESEALTDELEEARLRNVIGELDDARWSDRSTELDSRLTDARNREAEAREEVSRLEELLAQIEERGETAEIAAPDPASVENAAAEDEQEQPIVAEVEAEEEDGVDFFSLEETLEEGARGVPGSANQPVGFLADIDRALSGKADAEGNGGAQRNAPSLSVENLEDTAPKPGLKCGECGYTNDLGAWFCGVCGADVG